MMQQNHPTFIILWLAILKVGAVAAFINNNLAEDSLLHCIKVADAKMLIFDPKYEAQVATITGREDVPELVAFGEATEVDDLPDLPFASALTPTVLAKYSDADVSDDLIRNTSETDKAMLIYTR
jgi:acyl-CoA synthetase (AMP-forming)/AMP-acid ligase II